MGQCFGLMDSKKVPARIVDPHHHFYTPSVEAGAGSHSGFLRKLGAPDYPPEEYIKDKGSLNIVKSVHVEALPDDGAAEVEWVASLVKAKRAPTIKAIVGKVDLAAPDAGERLDALVKAAPDLVKGVRYIIDYDGPFGGDNGTHPEVSRHGEDYLRGGKAEDFEMGFSLLAARGLSYDLQCAPAQLQAAAALVARHPQVPVVLDHAGKVRKLDGSHEDGEKLRVWQEGVTELAKLDHVYVKLSMLGFLVPGWTEDAAKEELVIGLVKELLDLFGPSRCMFASNWHGSGASSNADYCDTCEPTMTELYAKFQAWCDGPLGLNEAEQALVFAGTAEAFYRI